MTPHLVIPAQAGIQPPAIHTIGDDTHADGRNNPDQLARSAAPPMPEKQPAVYILASHRNGTLYIGVTSDLVRRTFQHRNDLIEGFSQRYGVHQLVHYELHDSMEGAITREKQLKKWRRAWKLRLIETQNPEWRDLWPDLTG